MASSSYDNLVGVLRQYYNANYIRQQVVTGAQIGLISGAAMREYAGMAKLAKIEAQLENKEEWGELSY